MTAPSAAPGVAARGSVAATSVAPSVVQSASAANSERSTRVLATFTTAPATGDLLLAGLSYYYNGGASPITAPAGWTILSEGTHGNTGLGVYYRYAQAGDSLTWTWVSRLKDYLSVGLVDFANVAPASVPAIATDVTQANSVTPTTPALTPTVANSLPVGLFGINIGQIRPQTFSPGSGFTTVLAAFPLYHALGIEQGIATSASVRATAKLQTSSQLSTALVVLAPGSSPSPPPTPPATSFVDWTTYGFDNHRDGFNPSSSALTPGSLSALHLSWQQIAYNGDNATQSQPVLATNLGNHAGLLFVGGKLGFVYAFDALSGALVWKTPLGVEQFTCSNGKSSQLGIGGSVAYDQSSRTIYVSDNVNTSPNAPATNSLVRLDAASGAQLGSVALASSALPGEFNFAHTAIALANGYAYAGTGSTCDIPSWRGRVAAVSMNASGSPLTFYTAYGVGGNFSGAGVWSWGGVAIDDAGFVYAATGNADVTQGVSGPQPPFQQTTNQQAGYGENVIKLSADLSTLMGANYPGGNNGPTNDVDLSGTPVLFQPFGCSDTLLAEQGKTGELLVFDTLNVGGGPIARYRVSPTTKTPADLSSPAWSPSTGLLYVNVASGTGGSIDPPGMIALHPSGCGGSTAFAIAWYTAFGPDSFTGAALEPRSAPTVTAGGVVFVGTPCTADLTGGCNPTIGSSFGGAVWALDASSGALLNNGKPVLLTGGYIRAPAVADGAWVYVQDDVANLYGLTIDPNYLKIRSQHRAVAPPSSWYPNGR